MASPARESGFSAALSSLRDTAKWLVGGVVATAVGVFAGTSLTSLGSLDPLQDLGRLALAGVGAVLGFFALGLIMWRAIPVLTVEVATFRDLAAVEDQKAPDPLRVRTVSETIRTKYQSEMPAGVNSFVDYAQAVDAQRVINPQTADTTAYIEKAAQFSRRVMPHAGFLLVRSRFDRLIAMLWIAVPLAIAGFGVFAWAANPSDPPADMKPPAPARLTIIQGTPPGSKADHAAAAPCMREKALDQR